MYIFRVIDYTRFDCVEIGSKVIASMENNAYSLMEKMIKEPHLIGVKVG